MENALDVLLDAETSRAASFRLCLSEIKLARTDDEVRREMA
jgi:hypothetical protein